MPLLRTLRNNPRIPIRIPLKAFHVKMTGFIPVRLQVVRWVKYRQSFRLQSLPRNSERGRNGNLSGNLQSPRSITATHGLENWKTLVPFMSCSIAKRTPLQFVQNHKHRTYREYAYQCPNSILKSICSLTSSGK